MVLISLKTPKCITGGRQGNVHTGQETRMKGTITGVSKHGKKYNFLSLLSEPTGQMFSDSVILTLPPTMFVPLCLEAYPWFQKKACSGPEF